MEKKELENRIKRLLKESSENHPLFIVTKSGEKKEVHLASKIDISDIFSFVGSGVSDVVMGTRDREGVLYVLFSTDDFDNIKWQNYAKLESLMEELQTHYINKEDPDIIDYWEIHTVKRRLAIHFNNIDYEIIF